MDHLTFIFNFSHTRHRHNSITFQFSLTTPLFHISVQIVFFQRQTCRWFSGRCEMKLSAWKSRKKFNKNGLCFEFFPMIFIFFLSSPAISLSLFLFHLCTSDYFFLMRLAFYRLRSPSLLTPIAVVRHSMQCYKIKRSFRHMTYFRIVKTKKFSEW